MSLSFVFDACVRHVLVYSCGSNRVEFYVWECPICGFLFSLLSPISGGLIGRFSKAGLHEWIPFIIFHARSQERSQLPLPGWFLSRHWFMVCITMELASRIVKLYKCHYCCIFQNLQGKGYQGWKKVSLHHFSADLKKDWECMDPFCVFLASYSTSNKLLLVARHILTTDLQKCLQSWHCHANSLSPPAIVKKVCIGSGQGT